MLNEFVTRVLVLLLGYAYPAFECFKAMEMGRVHVEQLHFWCQYWVIVAILTVFEKFFDIFVSWLPLYSETKLAFFIYLWHPTTQGTTWVYAAFLRPLVRQHEPDIEEKLKHFRAKSADLLLFYIKNFTDQGKNLFLELMHMVVAQTPESSPTTEPPRRPEPSAPPHPITIKRSNHRSSSSEPGVYTEPDTMDVNSDEFPLNSEVEEALRASRIKLPRFRKKK
ncbi:putative HVA22-like protein g [Iris pallida]|uniref:HVA22-like protein n=1 Tax=Iris pallida TaxID=29817 RepID=A0AAX6FMS6_IRIPA|nr:putative HVA22-like protein g [Iris pallida]